MFRAEALEARYAESPSHALPGVSTSWWVLLSVSVSAVFVLIGVGWFGRVEVTSTAMGTLRVQSGPRPVLAQTSGTVSELLVGAGERVSVGQPVAKLQAAQLEAQHKKLFDQRSLREEGQRRARALSSDLHTRTLQALKRKRSILSQRLELEENRVSRLAQRERDIRALQREGVASGTEALEAQAALDTAREGTLVLRQQVADVTIELLDRENTHGTELLDRELSVQESGVALVEAEALAELAILSAPVSGRVESLLVSAGQVVPNGATVARIVPEGDVNRAVVFVPSKEAAFVRDGLAAHLEFPSLPVSDFGRARARVERVGHDVASAAEVADVLEAAVSGADAVVRVELVIEDDATWRKMAPRLRSGARVTARLMTRERRILSLAFDFMKQWLPE
jgi:multidrug resistance efflux pump